MEKIKLQTILDTIKIEGAVIAGTIQYKRLKADTTIQVSLNSLTSVDSLKQVLGGLNSKVDFEWKDNSLQISEYFFNKMTIEYLVSAEKKGSILLLNRLEVLNVSEEGLDSAGNPIFLGYTLAFPAVLRINVKTFPKDCKEIHYKGIKIKRKVN